MAAAATPPATRDGHSCAPPPGGTVPLVGEAANTLTLQVQVIAVNVSVLLPRPARSRSAHERA